MILHICTAAEWAAVPEGGEYRAPSLDSVGFIHCSDPGTAHLPANALYAGRTDLVLLEIDPDRLGVRLRWEPGQPVHPSGIWFPHVYGQIPHEAVLAAHAFPVGSDGFFPTAGVPGDSVTVRNFNPRLGVLRVSIAWGATGGGRNAFCAWRGDVRLGHAGRRRYGDRVATAGSGGG